MLEFNSVMGDFYTSFELVLCETIGSLLEEVDIHSHGCNLDYILSKIAPILSERRYKFFTDGGFSARVLSLLSRSRVITADGSRITTDGERAKILDLSMNVLRGGIDSFVTRYVIVLLSSVTPVSRSGSAQSVEVVVEGGEGKSKSKGEKRRREEVVSDVVPARFGSMLVRREFNDDLARMISEHTANFREVVRSIVVDLSGYPHLTVEARRNAMYEQSRAANKQ